MLTSANIRLPPLRVSRVVGNQLVSVVVEVIAIKKTEREEL